MAIVRSIQVLNTYPGEVFDYYSIQPPAVGSPVRLEKEFKQIATGEVLAVKGNMVTVKVKDYIRPEIKITGDNDA